MGKLLIEFHGGFCIMFTSELDKRGVFFAVGGMGFLYDKDNKGRFIELSGFFLFGRFGGYFPST